MLVVPSLPKLEVKLPALTLNNSINFQPDISEKLFLDLIKMERFKIRLIS